MPSFSRTGGRHAGADATGDGMSARVVKREPVPQRGSHEVLFSDGRRVELHQGQPQRHARRNRWSGIFLRNTVAAPIVGGVAGTFEARTLTII
jgi:hypothetical protein